MSNALNPNQARHFVGPDLDSNCLYSLSAGDKGERVVCSNCIISQDLKKISFKVFGRNCINADQLTHQKTNISLVTIKFKIIFYNKSTHKSFTNTNFNSRRPL